MLINDEIYKLYLNKQESGLSWDDIACVINSKFGTILSGDSCRKRVSRMLTNFISDSLDESSVEINLESEECSEEEVEETEECDNQQVNQSFDLFEAKQNRLQATALYNRMSREELLKKLALEAADRVAKEKPFLPSKLYGIPCAGGYGPSETALLLISDWHYGIQIDNYKNFYDTKVCKDRVSELVDYVNAKISVLGIKELVVLNLGDMICGNIHLPLRINSQIDVVTQTEEVTELIAETLNCFAKHPKIEKIRYYQVLDNHSRIDPNKKDSMQLESFARFSKWFLRERFKDIKTVEICDNEIDEDIATFTIGKDFNVVGVHGDKDAKDTIIQSLNLFIKDGINLVCAGHLHHFSADTNSGIKLISNGSLMGTDNYAFQKRLSGVPSQTFITFRESEFETKLDGIFQIDSDIYS